VAVEEEEELHSSAGVSDNQQNGGGGGGLHAMGQAAGLCTAGVAASVSAGSACGEADEIRLLRRCSVAAWSLRRG